MTRKEYAKKILSATVVMLMFGTFSASADVLEYSYSQDGTLVEISGVAETEKNISIEVLNAGVTGEPEYTDVIYAKMLKADALEENKFTFNIPMQERSSSDSLPTNNYSVIINGQDFEEATKFTLKYVNPDDFDAVLEDLKETGLDSLDAFKGFLDSSSNSFILNCDTVLDGADEDDVREIMYNTIKDNISDINSSEDAKEIWNQSALLSLLNDEKVDDINTYKEYLDLSDKDVLKWYEHLENQSVTEALTEKISGEDFESLEDFEKSFTEALILTTVKYPDGVSNIGLILDDFSDITGISETGKTSKYKELAGQDFSSIKSLVSAYEDAGSSDKGGSGSGSGSGSGGGKGSAAPVAKLPTTTPAQGEIRLSFIDLDTVPWAYEAISALTDKGIVSGRSETRFMPDEPVTRQEFVKLCVALAGLSDESYENHFTDIVPGSWYESYVNIAYEKGIVNGQGGGMFGVDQSITRQDMAVMLYNTLKYCGWKGTTGDLSFTDAGSISDYAKEAVLALSSYGAINGMGDNTFAPFGTATRAQAAKVIFEVLDILK